MRTMQGGGLVERQRENVVGHGKKVGYASKVIRKKHHRCKKRTAEDYGSRATKVQELFLACKDVFKGPGTVPSPFDVQRLSTILDDMKPEDVGLSRKLQFFTATEAAKETPRVADTTIYQCDKFSLRIFFLPATAVIPLHNHPGMTVFSKLLLGTMHIKSYDWADAPDSDPSTPTNSQLRLARLKANGEFTAPCKTNVLYPTTGGNIHEFKAITPCAVLDVIGPPYSSKDGRDCSYYKEFPFSSFTSGETRVTREEGENYGWLEEIEAPEESRMYEIEYLGPQVVDTSC